MTDLPLVISYYTEQTPYESEVERLIASCRKFSIEAQIEPLPSLGSWEKNCAQKAAFILEKLKKAKRSVFWVDADAAFLQAPKWHFFSQCDFSVRVNEFLPKTHESRVISNAIFANATPQVIAIVEEWVEKCQSELDKQPCMPFWDQVALRDVLAKHSKLSFVEMPLRFSKIFDFDDLFISEEEVVIEHYQASRRFKRLIHDSCCHN